MTRDELEAALHARGWRVIAGPTRTASGYKATIARGTASMLAIGTTELGVLADLLRSAQERARHRP